MLTRAIHQNKVSKIVYRSLSSAREIVPFVLVDNGLHWHIRDYNRKRLRSADFVVTRILDPAIVDEPVKDRESRKMDIRWNRVVELEIVPHSCLKHPETIETDYAMKNGVLKVKVRSAVDGYVLRRWNIDCSKNHSLEGPECHLHLKNHQALYGVENKIVAPGYNKDNRTSKDGS